nr:helix-turn-helix transcriptional regulator [Bacteroides intestinalis]
MKLRIKEVCQMRNTTQKELAEKLGVSEVTLSRASNGNTSLPLLEKIANILEIEISELFAPSSSGGIIGVIRIRDTNYNINSVPDLSRLLDRIESGEIVL